MHETNLSLLHKVDVVHFINGNDGILTPLSKETFCNLDL